MKKIGVLVFFATMALMAKPDRSEIQSAGNFACQMISDDSKSCKLDNYSTSGEWTNRHKYVFKCLCKSAHSTFSTDTVRIWDDGKKEWE